MSQFEKIKYETINRVRSLCRHCSDGEVHDCPVSRTITEIENIRGVPIMVNDRLHHVMFM